MVRYGISGVFNWTIFMDALPGQALPLPSRVSLACPVLLVHPFLPSACYEGYLPT